MVLTKGKIQTVREAVERALNEVGDKHELVFKLGRISYGDTFFRMGIEATMVGALTQEEELYDRMRQGLALPERGVSVFMKGIEYQVFGWNGNAPKFPVLLSLNGRVAMKCTPDALRRAINDG